MKYKRGFVFITTLFVSIILILICGGSVGLKIAKKYNKEAVEIVMNVDESTFMTKATSIIYDKNGKQISKLYSEVDSTYVNYDDINPLVEKAVVAVEDRRFYDHNGMDLKGITRAFVELVKNNGRISGGGSTLTQQLVKNTIIMDSSKTFERKLKEVFISLELEQKYNKKEIVEFYLNNINFANNIYGIETASQYYFNKTNKELNLSEIAFLIGIPNRPEYYNPIKNYENTVTRRNWILDKMLETEVITTEEYNEAKNHKVQLSDDIKKDNYGENYGLKMYILKDFAETMMEKNGFEFKYEFKSNEEYEEYKKLYDEAYDESVNSIYGKGYKIYTSIDMDLQNNLQSQIDKNLKSFKEQSNEIYKMQGAATSIDNETGMVVAMVGGRSSTVIDYLNRAYQTYRQPASTFKPLVVYSPAFEEGYLPSDRMSDAKTPKGPNNAYKKSYGNITLRYALERSSNVIPDKLYNKIGYQKALSGIYKMEFRKIMPSDKYSSTAIGGLTYGTNTLEMAAAYSVYSRNGEYIRPTSIEKIIDNEGNIVYQREVVKKKVFSSEANYMTYDMLKSNMESGMGKSLALSNKNVETAGKTGTTNDNKDGWFVGLSKNITTAVWVGYDTPKSVKSLYGSSYPGKIWKDFMEYAHKDCTEKLRVEMPNTLTKVYIDSNGKTVPSNYPGAKLEIFPNSNLPKKNENAEKEIVMFGYESKIKSILSKQISLDEIRNELNNYKNILQELVKKEELSESDFNKLVNKMESGFKELQDKINSEKPEEDTNNTNDTNTSDNEQ